MAVRSALHRAGATALTKLLQFPVPSADQPNIPCPCGHQARYQELRSKPIVTVGGKSEVLRPYYLCAHCHNGQFPIDVELDLTIRNSLLECGACRRSWVRHRLSITGASR